MTHQNYTNFAQMPDNENSLLPANQNSEATTLVEEVKKHRALYPEVHYKLKPFISVTCDAIQATGMSPTQQDMDEIADNIYDDFCKMHPEMENYMKADNDGGADPEAVPAITFGRGYGYGRSGYPGFRRRGLGRDLIGALLLGELAGRGFPYYQYSSCYPYCSGGPYYPRW